MDEWLGRLDIDVLFGERADASAFNDTRLGLTLDHLDAAGTDTILSELASRYLARDTGPFTLHHDTTSVSLYGAYEQPPADPAARIGSATRPDAVGDRAAFEGGAPLDGRGRCDPTPRPPSSAPPATQTTPP